MKSDQLERCVHLGTQGWWVALRKVHRHLHQMAQACVVHLNVLPRGKTYLRKPPALSGEGCYIAPSRCAMRSQLGQPSFQLRKDLFVANSFVLV